MWARLTHLFLPCEEPAGGGGALGSMFLVGVAPSSRREDTRKVGGEGLKSWTMASTKRPGSTSMRRATFVPTVTCNQEQTVLLTDRRFQKYLKSTFGTVTNLSRTSAQVP